VVYKFFVITRVCL